MLQRKQGDHIINLMWVASVALNALLVTYYLFHASSHGYSNCLCSIHAPYKLSWNTMQLL